VQVDSREPARPQRELGKEDARPVADLECRRVPSSSEQRHRETEPGAIDPCRQRLEVVVDRVVIGRLRHERARRQHQPIPGPDIGRSHGGPLYSAAVSTILPRRPTLSQFALTDLQVTGVPPSRGEDDHLDRVAGFFDGFAYIERQWRERNRTYYRLIESVHRFLIPERKTVLEIGAGSGDLLASVRPARGVGVDVSPGMVALARSRHPQLEFVAEAGERFVRDEQFDYVILSDVVPFAYDLQAILRNVRAMTNERSRVIIHSYSQLWRPVIRFAEIVGLKPKKPLSNWVTPEDLRNLLELTDFEIISVERRILLPKRVPFVSTFLNGVVANVWPLSHLSLTWWVVARPKPSRIDRELGVSIVVPCRNEAGMIEEIVARTPALGTSTEIIFVEGGSTDGTREEIERQIARHPDRPISLQVQTGVGKGDAVRLGFEKSRHELLMILDADLTVSPEDLDKFYRAVSKSHADFANGSRLVYDMQSGAMQFLNLLGNKVFSTYFSFLLAQPIKDTLCGTKVLLRRDYEEIVSSRTYFGDFDPFGDFDLLLGAARRTLKIVDIPVRYGARRYGKTNISRFRHGLLLLQMAAFGFYKLKIKPTRV
jgi:SAM-dependent methyltransferase